MSPNNHLSFSKSYMLSVHEGIKNFVFLSSPMSRYKKLSKVKCQQPLVCWHGSVAFPILPIHIANVVCTRSNKNFVFISSPMSRFKKLSKVRCQQPLVCWHRSVAFPILPIHIANLFQLSKCTPPITSIPKPLKLSNSQISYRIWQMSILMFARRVSDNQV